MILVDIEIDDIYDEIIEASKLIYPDGAKPYALTLVSENIQIKAVFQGHTYPQNVIMRIYHDNKDFFHSEYSDLFQDYAGDLNLRLSTDIGKKRDPAFSIEKITPDYTNESNYKLTLGKAIKENNFMLNLAEETYTGLGFEDNNDILSKSKKNIDSELAAFTDKFIELRSSDKYKTYLTASGKRDRVFASNNVFILEFNHFRDESDLTANYNISKSQVQKAIFKLDALGVDFSDDWKLIKR